MSKVGRLLRRCFRSLWRYCGDRWLRVQHAGETRFGVTDRASRATRTFTGRSKRYVFFLASSLVACGAPTESTPHPFAPPDVAPAAAVGEAPAETTRPAPTQDPVSPPAQTPTPVPAALRVDERVSFGYRRCGDATPFPVQRLTVTNAGEVATVAGNVTLGGDDAASFATSPVLPSIAPGASVQIEVSAAITASAERLYRATLTVVAGPLVAEAPIYAAVGDAALPDAFTYSSSRWATGSRRRTKSDQDRGKEVDAQRVDEHADERAQRDRSAPLRIAEGDVLDHPQQAVAAVEREIQQRG